MVDATIFEKNAQNVIQSNPPCTLQGRSDLTPLDTAGILAVRRWIFHGQKMPAWLVRTMMVKDYVAFHGGVMVKYVWLSSQQFEEISIFALRCFQKAIDHNNNNPVSIL